MEVVIHHVGWIRRRADWLEINASEQELHDFAQTVEHAADHGEASAAFLNDDGDGYAVAPIKVRRTDNK